LTAALLRRLLAHPLTASLSIDDPATTQLRKQIILSKPILKAIYDEWYGMLSRELPPVDGQILELGSGGGYCDRFISGLITSEIFVCPGMHLNVDGHRLPFGRQSLRAIVMTNVLHHLPDVRRFFAEASRCVRRGGKILLIEPWVTPWSRFVYKYFHSEPFHPEAQEWSFPSNGPLSGANIALPWIVFARDRDKFESEFSDLLIEKIRPFLAFRYWVSGGVGMRSLMPGFTGPIWERFERKLESQMNRLGMFAFISVLRR